MNSKTVTIWENCEQVDVQIVEIDGGILYKEQTPAGFVYKELVPPVVYDSRERRVGGRPLCNPSISGWFNPYIVQCDNMCHEYMSLRQRAIWAALADMWRKAGRGKLTRKDEPRQIGDSETMPLVAPEWVKVLERIL